ncbi:glutamate synthase (NADPH), homotetrameric family protein [Peptoniphilus sp. oral taxon 375 str. F0436]|nr:glutamate synthase (NADPH), homotetrameric family protein [Peptoniphilus sp. oral taxon 375 str. F0436]
MDNKSQRFQKVPVAELDPEVRKNNFQEVCLGYTKEEAIKEAHRCLQCKVPRCRKGCPVSIDIPKFIYGIANENFKEAIESLWEDTSLPAICGRVCPQEKQCEKYCVLTNRGDSVSIGKLERFAADYARDQGWRLEGKNQPTAIKLPSSVVAPEV